MEKRKLVIVGSGPAGYTAAIYAARADLAPLVLAGEQFGGQLMNTTLVENWPGRKNGILGPELMLEMREQAVKFGATMVDKFVTAVDLSQRPFRLWTNVPQGVNLLDLLARGDGEELEQAKQQIKEKLHDYEAEALIVATGAVSLFLGIPGEAKLLGRGVATCAVCDAAFYKEKVVYVVGGGDAAVEDTLALTKFAREVKMVVRRDELRASKIMAKRVLEHPKVEVLWNSEILEVAGEVKLEKVRLRNIQTGDTRELSADGLFYAIGHKPVTEIFKGQLELDAKGYLVSRLGYTEQGLGLAQNHLDRANLVEYPTTTSVEGVFGAGDVVDFRYRQAITAAGMGCQAALDAERWLEGQADSA